MANVKISDLPAASTPLTGAELVPIVQSGVTSQATAINVANTILPTLAADSGAALIGFTGANNAVTTVSGLASNSGAALIGYLPAGSSTATTVASSIDTLRSIDNDILEQTVISLSNGTAVTVSCFGDSTMWGADPASLAAQVAIPSPSELQNFVNTFIGNSALTVTNNAISGTTATQMINGTDGSGSTFASKMATSTATVIYCNHGVNDAYGANATSLAQYQSSLLSYINICRQYNKTPVLVTPYPALTIGTFGSQARAEATARFAESMRQIADKHGVKLIDNNKMLTQYMTMPGITPISVLPDGVHGTQATYVRAGNNLAEAILGAQTITFTQENQKIPATSAAFRCTNQTINTDGSSSVGAVQVTGSTAGNTMRIVFNVSQPGLDIYLAATMFSSCASNFSINLDGTGIGNYNQYIAGFNSTNFWHDYETQIIRNVPAGFHILIMTTVSAGAITCNYLRSRNTLQPITTKSTGSTPIIRKPLYAQLDISSSTTNNKFILDAAPVPNYYVENTFFEYTWTGQMEKNSGLIFGGVIGSLTGPASVESSRIFGLDASGYLSVWEATGPATYTATTLGSTDLSTASHDYRIVIGTGMNFYVDGVLIGNVAFSLPYFGGSLGLWKDSSAGTMSVYNLTFGYRE